MSTVCLLGGEEDMLEHCLENSMKLINTLNSYAWKLLRKSYEINKYVKLLCKERKIYMITA